MTLGEALQDGQKRKAIVADATGILESEVAEKRGLRGAAIRAGFGAFRKLGPNMVPGAIDKLLPHFAPVVDRHIAAGREGGDVEAYFSSSSDAIATDLLGVTDGLADRANNRVMKKIYSGLRGQAHGHVKSGVPKIGGLATRHLSA